MPKKKKAPYVISIVFSFFPAILTFVCKSEGFLDSLQDKGILGSNIDTVVLKDILLIISIVLTFILLTTRLIKKQYYMDNAIQQRNKLLAMNKEIFTITLAKQLGEEYLNIDIRIFVPKVSLISRIKDMFKITHKKYFKIKNINSLSESGTTDNLIFEVSPNQQGLVGNCYSTKSIVYDADLTNTNSLKYNLNNSQIYKTSDLKFVLCCPLFLNNDVIGIMAFDSKQRINMTKQQHDKLRDPIVVFSQSIYEHIPELFKPIGGIL